MTRIERLELALQHLSERILGEGITLDAIAEREADEQGVVYTPPPAQPAPDLEPLIERIAALESRPAPVPQEFPDLTPVLEAISHLAKRVSDLESRPVNITMELDPRIPDLEAKCATLARHLIEQETAMQKVMQAASDLERLVGIILDHTKCYDPDVLQKFKKAG